MQTQNGAFSVGKWSGRLDFFHSLGLACLSLFCLSFPSHAIPENTLPTGYSTSAGSVQFQQSGSTLNINSSSNAAIVNFQSFNVGQNATVNMNLPSSNAAILNRVTGGTASEIYGKINSNGNVFLINPSGILFGSTAQVNVGSLVASTLDINDEDFLTKKYSFSSPGNGQVINKGSINSANGGMVALLGGAVSNEGSINAASGQVHLAVGNSISIPVENGVMVDVKITETLKNKVVGKSYQFRKYTR